MRKINAKFITKSAIVAALYAALTFVFMGVSYGAIQFRVSEILVLLVFFDKRYFWGLLIGCIISNFASPMLFIDIVVGSSASAIAMMFIIFIRKIMGESNKSLIIASLGPVISNAILVGIELTVLFKELPFIFNAMYVAIGEFAVVTVTGVAIFSFAKNQVKRVIQ